jgi:peptide/nickel transport system permease protein
MIGGQITTLQKIKRISKLLTKEKIVLVGGVMIAIMLLAVILAPWLSPYDPVSQDISKKLHPPSASHLLGTDLYGRDVLSRLIFGTRVSLPIGFLSIGISSFIGICIGLLAGYHHGGRFDNLVLWTVDIFMSFPTILLAMFIAIILGTGFLITILAITVAFIPRFIRLVRASALTASKNPYVDAVRALGQSDFRIMFFHVLPNIISPILIMAAMWMSTAIRVEASLSFLGLGVQPPTPSWGVMIKDAIRYITTNPLLTVWPGLSISFATIAFNMIGDGLRDLMDPRLKK